MIIRHEPRVKLDSAVLSRSVYVSYVVGKEVSPLAGV
jgi:hypothetical protein